VRVLLPVVTLVLLLYCATHMRVVSDVASFMPTSGSSELAALSRALTDSDLSRTMVLSIGAPSPAEVGSAVDAARALALALREHPEVAWVREGAGPEQLEAAYGLYFPRRHGFLSDRPREELPQRLSDAGLREAARRLRAELARPSAPLVARIAGEDPLLAFPGILERVRAGQSELELRDGVFVTRDGHHAILFLGTHASPFDSAHQQPLLAAIYARFAEIAGAAPAELRLEMAGVNRFALQIEESIRREIVWLFGLSSAGVAVLFLTFFRSPRVLATAVLPHAMGALVAASVGLALFGHLNGLAIAFGVSLIGVSIDYATHLLVHHSFAPTGTPALAVARRLRPSLLLGGATTIASLAGLAFAKFPGFYQMGVLATVGVSAALAVALWVVPALVGPLDAPSVSRRAAALLGARMQALSHRRTALLGLSILCLAAGAWGVGRIAWVDDLSELTRMDETLLDEERRVRSRFSDLDGSRFLVARGATLEEALAANDRLAKRLPALVESGALGGHRSLHDLLWSQALQRENQAQLRADPLLPERLARAFEAEGFRPGAFEGFATALAAPPPAPLRYDDLMDSPLSDLVRSLVLDVDGGVGVVTYLQGLRRPEALDAAVADLPDVQLFDQKRFFREVYGEYRERIIGVVVSGVFAVLGLLLLRYRSLRPALAAALPSLLVAALLAALAAALQVETHVLHLIGLILVMGMGVDYGIFVVDGAGHDEPVGTTLLSLFLSCLTTIFTFGVMGFSEHPVLHAIGRTAGVGIALSFLLAPVSLAVLRPRPARGLNPS
jgi:predicted exporter